ncbi:U3 small nucleolar RNA-associated protein 18 homolog isoform X3 [Eubalaena glacialis]|uniref:U3 small nucleolar RNA-associated protein 18 homolog isoform X3 n=1 Tax=Eubalaena glacialis TaxID=27606 RepID=UPI002A5B109B|nr:U3 small nucleolar RNA-associated protein 18 homolog isoform X3 [Eubalaena glacialis]
MPPERRSRARPDRRAGARPDRKTRMRPDDRAGAGPGGPFRKAAPSSQRKSPARPRAAATVVAAEEERRLRQRNRQTLEEDKPAVERCLEELIFGDVEDDEDALLRRLRGPRVQVQEDSGDSEVENEAKDNFPLQKKPVWLDEEDEDEEMVDMTNNRFRKDMMKNASENKLSKDQLQKRLKEEFQHAMGGVPAWAETSKRKTSSDDESEEDEDDLLQRTGNFISTSTSLPKGILKMKHCQHANAERPTTARISSVQFHPRAQVVMVAGLDNAVSLFQTKELIGSMKINGRIAASTFSSDSKKVYASSGDGDVYVWDVNSRKCLNRFVDEGSLYGLSIATSRNGQYVACGSNCGVVNIYNQDSCLQEANPKPIKAIMNLVTGVTSLTFNPTTEILAIASEKMKEAVRLVHLPSCTVFSNFPVVKKKNISLVHSMDFSPRSGYFALGNEKGKALLYRLHHYSDF